MTDSRAVASAIILRKRRWLPTNEKERKEKKIKKPCVNSRTSIHNNFFVSYVINNEWSELKYFGSRISFKIVIVFK